MERLTSRRNPLCLHIKKLGESRRYREESGEFLCDGMKLLEEAVSCGAGVTAVLTASPVPIPLDVDTRVYYTDRSLINSLSPLKNAQDTLFTCRIPKTGGPDDVTGAHILLDGVQDPGNVGTIIRTANAFGVKSVILTGGCADPYNPKTIRATMGAIFRQNIHITDVKELAVLREKGVLFVCASPGVNGRDIREVSIKDAVIAIGNEGRGLSDEVLALCDGRINIPMAPGCESLNAAVAAAIILWETVRSVECRVYSEG